MNKSSSPINNQTISYQSIKRKNWIWIGGLILVLCITVLLSLNAGVFGMDIPELLKAIFGQSTTQNNMVMHNVRLPRVVTAVICGFGLALTGAVLQSVLKNPLAASSTLGVSQGAAFGAAFAIIVFGAGAQGVSAASSVTYHPLVISICAFLGGMVASVVVLLLSRFRKITPESMVLCGVALSAMFTGATTLLQYFSDDVQVATVVFWTFGDLGRTGWKEIQIITLITLMMFFYSMFNRWKYNALQSGEETALSLGINVTSFRVTNMVLCALTASVIVSFIGIINFIGLVAPHVCRRLLGNNYSYLLPASALAGAILLFAGDLVARQTIPPIILPIGAITSFLGAPLFLYLLFKGGASSGSR